MKKSSLLQWVFIALLVLIVCRYICDIFNICTGVPKGMVLVEKATVDSLKAYILLSDSLETLANLPPDTIHIYDTIYVDTVKIAITTPEQTEVDSSINHYSDTLKNDEINVAIEFDVAGHLASQVEWRYKPIIKETTTIIEKPIPYPVIETVEVEKIEYVTGHYLSIHSLGNDKMFIFGVDYGIVTENMSYGLNLYRFGDNTVYGVRAGINIKYLINRIKHGP